jgi:hypothetical protein
MKAALKNASFVKGVVLVDPLLLKANRAALSTAVPVLCARLCHHAFSMCHVNDPCVPDSFEPRIISPLNVWPTVSTFSHTCQQLECKPSLLTAIPCRLRGFASGPVPVVARFVYAVYVVSAC